MQVLAVFVLMGLIIYVAIARDVLTAFGTCPSEFNTVWAGRCATSWLKKGPSVQCDGTSKFDVPYWFSRIPLCTISSVNAATTVMFVLLAVSLVIGFSYFKG
jgi:hypothetical protein